MRATDSVLWLTLGGRDMASSRVRAFRVSDALEKSGIRSRCVVAAGVRGRLRALVQLCVRGRVAVIVVQKLLYGSSMLRLLRWRSDVLVWECDDALHVGYPGSRPSEAAKARRLVAAALRVVDVVTTSNPLLAEELRPASGRVTTFQGPAPSPAALSTARERVLVWLGSPSTEKYLSLLSNIPNRLRAAGWECVAVGATGDVSHLGWRPVQWSFGTQEEWLSKAIVGVMPQTSEPWSDRKQGYKLFEYMAHGVVPVASDVLPARMVMDDSRLRPLLVGDNADWAAAIETAAASREHLLPCFQAVLRRHSVESSVGVWTKAVGLEAAL